MYGALTGQSKQMIANKYGEDQLKKWRRGFKVQPPAVSSYSLNYPVSLLNYACGKIFCTDKHNRKHEGERLQAG